MTVYAILIHDPEFGVKLLPKYFNTYQEALANVKKLYRGVWDDKYEADGTLNEYPNNKVEVKEGHKISNLDDPNITELYIEKGIDIIIRRLVKQSSRASTRGGRQCKGNTKNSRKHRI